MGNSQPGAPEGGALVVARAQGAHQRQFGSKEAREVHEGRIFEKFEATLYLIFLETLVEPSLT